MRSLLALLALAALAAAPTGEAASPSGSALYSEGCISCHGPEGRGIDESAGARGARNQTAYGPSLEGVGAASAHLYLSTGYMPLVAPDDPPARSAQTYSDAELQALVAYVSTLSHGGPSIPDVHPEQGDLALGFRAFTTSCAGCHQLLGRGGVAGGAVAPPLGDSTAQQIGEAIRVGPYVMPQFSEETIDDHTVDSIAAYVLDARSPRDDGGWALGHVGPVPEGALAWAVAGLVLVGIARLLGKAAR